MHFKASSYFQIFMCYKAIRTAYGHALPFQGNHRHSSRVEQCSTFIAL